MQIVNLNFLSFVLLVPFLIWADYKPGEELDSEKDDDKVVDEVDDEDDAGEVNLPLLVLLQLLNGGEDEGDCGDEHHRQGEEGYKLSKPAIYQRNLRS